MSSSDYSIGEHVHRFSIWAAARASSTVTRRFSVAEAKTWIESVPEIRTCADNQGSLPEPSQFDSAHKNWREQIRVASGTKEVSHGIAAKLINVYLKSTLVRTEFVFSPNVMAIHPPIDRLLLKELVKKCPKIWSGQKLSWSTFTSEEYQDVIDKIRKMVGDKGMWTVEQYWPGHQ
jgi:hypothetical protein